MSQHPSLRQGSKDKAQRSVMKRYERIKLLKSQGGWEDKQSVYGLSKVKVTRFKAKKEKAAKADSAAPESAAASVPAADATAKKAAK